MAGIGIFTSEEKGSEEKKVAFFGCVDTSLMAMLYQEASKIAGHGVTKFDPKDGMRAKRVGEVSVSSVEDSDTYIVDAEKEETGRKPDGKVGDWVVQSIIFSKDSFSKEQAETWISDSKDFGNYGVDETDTSYRFRQYDPDSFSEFRTTELSDGVAAVYGQIGESKDAEESAKAAEESLSKFYAVKGINKSIMKQGVKILCGSASSVIMKADDGEEVEERFVLSMVLEPTDGQNGSEFKPDTQDDVYSESDVRKAAHAWMENYGAVDLMHSWRAIGKQDVRTLESYIAPVEFELGGDKVQKGSWMLGLRIANDDLWKAIKSGDLGAYSIGGTANRVPMEQA